MLVFEDKWKILEYFKKKNIEYFENRFYGPYLKMVLEEYEDGTKRVTPISSSTETAEFSASHLSILAKAAKELYSKLGEFKLLIPKYGIEVKIDSQDTEGLILNTIFERIKRDFSLF